MAKRMMKGYFLLGIAAKFCADSTALIQNLFPKQRWIATNNLQKHCHGRPATSANGSMPAREAKSSRVEILSSRVWSQRPYCSEMLRPARDKDSTGIARTLE